MDSNMKDFVSSVKPNNELNNQASNMPITAHFGQPFNPDPVTEKEEESIFSLLSSHLVKALVPAAELAFEAVDLNKEFAAKSKNRPAPTMFNLGGVFIKHPSMEFTVGYIARKQKESIQKLKAKDEQPIYKIDRDRAEAKRIRH